MILTLYLLLKMYYNLQMEKNIPFKNIFNLIRLNTFNLKVFIIKPSVKNYNPTKHLQF